MTTTLPNTLEGLFLEGQKLYTKVSDADFDDDGDRERTITKATDVLEALQKEISREGVFSANEDLEEVATEMLPLLAADFYLGSLITKLPFNSPEARHEMLKRAETLLFRYLDTCERLVLFEEADLGAWQSMCKDGERSSTGSLRGVITREQKVERFRRQKRIRLKMEEIEHELSNDATMPAEQDARDGRRRERSLLLLASLAADALDEVSGMSKEMEMLEHRLKFREHDADKKQTRHGTADTRKTGLEVTRISRVGGSLNIRKEEVRAGVFKPTVALPTMTVEEYGEIELERARRRQEVEKGPSSTIRRYNQLEIDGDEDNEELVEKAVHRDRDWDDWKDEHPRGSGNKANKII